MTDLLSGFEVFSGLWNAETAWLQKSWLIPVNMGACGLISVEALMMMVFTYWRNHQGRFFIKATYGLTSFFGFAYVMRSFSGSYEGVSELEAGLHVCVALVFAELVLGWKRRYLTSKRAGNEP